MTSRDREISALLNLLDDPDVDVYHNVEQRLLTYGHSVIANLEAYWQHNHENDVQEKIEMIIHRIHFSNLQNEFTNWASGEADLLYGALLATKYHYPELQSVSCMQQIEKIRRNIWLEMNSYCTPLEQIKIVESILYNYYKLKGCEVAYNRPDDYMLNSVVESKRGNSISNGILYLVLAEMLDLPIRAIAIPKQFVLGYFSHKALFEDNFDEVNPSTEIRYFIDPTSGAAFAHKDIELYFKRVSINPKPAYFRPMTNKQVIKTMLEQFARCFEQPSEMYKHDELLSLAELIS